MLRKTKSLYQRTRQAVLLTIATCCVVMAAPSVRADTTLTSTNFASAYQDVDVVKQAAERGLTDQVFNALSSPDTSYDVRAAIVNALGWSFTGQHHAKTYLDYVASSHGKSSSALTIAELTPEEMFSLGYLLAMDNYGNPQAMLVPGENGEVEQANAVTLLDAVSNKLPDNFSVALIRSLVQARNAQISQDWCGAYKIVAGVVKDFPGQQNMRSARRRSASLSQAVEIVMGYMVTHQEYCPQT